MTPRVVLVDAGPWLPVPPGGYGGVENVVASLVAGLRRRGVRVHLATVGGSTLPCDAVVARFDRPQFDALAQPYTRGLGVAHAHMAEVTRHLAAHPEIDLVHSHLEVVGPAVLAALGPAAPPALHTLHWDPQRQRDFYERFDGGGRVFVNGVSAAHIGRAPANLRAHSLGHVLLATAAVPAAPRPGPDAPFVVLGRICPLKGQAIAARCGRRVGAQVLLAGPVAGATTPQELAAAAAELTGNADAAYWADEVEPLVDGTLVRWLGVLGPAARTELLQRARALLMPIQWEEPGATVVVEALAAGTPVVGMRRGALPELIEHGVTGFLADDEDGLERGMRLAHTLDRDACRAAAASRFGEDRMVDEYVRLYREVLRRAAPSATRREPASMSQLHGLAVRM